MSLIRKCHICKKEAPGEPFSKEWHDEKWMGIMTGPNVIAVFCPKHLKECDTFLENYSARGLKKK